MSEGRGNLVNGLGSRQNFAESLKRPESLKSVHSMVDGKRNSTQSVRKRSGSFSSSVSLGGGGLDILDDEIDKLNFLSFENGEDARDDESTVEDDEMGKQEEGGNLSEDDERLRSQRRFRPETPPGLVGDMEESIVWRVGRGVLACSLVGTILLVMISITLPIYLFVAWRLMPVPVKILRPLYFDYRLPNPTATVSFLTPNVLAAAQARFSTPKGSSWMGPRVLNPGQIFTITVSMVLPESDTNAAIGMFQVAGELLSVHEDVLGVASRPCMLRFRSMPVRWARRFVLGFPLLAGLSEEDQRLTLKLIENRKEGVIPMTGIRVSLGPKAGWPEGKGLPEIYEAVVTLEAVMTPAGLLMRCFRLTGVIWGIGGLFLWELFWVLICCRSVLFPKLQTPEYLRPVPIAAPANHAPPPKPRERRRSPIRKQPSSAKPRPPRKKSPVKSYKELSPEELLQCLREDEDELLSLLKEGDMKLQALGVNLDEKALPGDLGMPPLEKVSSAVESLPAVMESHSSMNSAQVSSISPEGHLNAKASDERDRGTDSLRGRGRGNGVEETGSGVRSSTESSRLRGMQQVEEKVMHGGSRAEATKRWVERDAGQAVGEPAMSVRGDGGNGMGARNHGLASSGGAVPGLRGVDVGGTGLSGGGVVGGERESGAAEKFVRKEGRRSPVLFEIEELEPLDRGWEVVESDKWKGKRPLSGSPGKRTGRQQNLLLRCSSTRSGGMGLERGAGASASGVKVGGFAGSKGERPHQREREYVTVAGDNRVPRGRDVPPLDERSAGRDGGGKERDSEVAMGGNDGVSLTNGSEAVGPRSELSGTEVGGLSREMEGGFPGGGVRGLWNGIGLQSRDSLPASSGDEEWDGSGRDFLSVQSERLSGVEDLVPGPNRGTIIRSSSDGSVECYQDSPTALDPPGLNDGEDEREVLPSDKRGYGVAGRELFEDAVGSLPDEDREVSFEGNSDREVAFLNAKFTLVEGREGGPSRSEQEHEVRGNLSAPTLEVGGVVRLGGSNSLRKRLLRTRDCVGLACLLQF